MRCRKFVNEFTVRWIRVHITTIFKRCFAISLIFHDNLTFWKEFFKMLFWFYLVLQSFWFVRVHPVSKFSSQETRILGGPGVFVARKPKRPVTHQQLSSTNLISLLLSDLSLQPLPSNLSLFWPNILKACQSFGNLAQFK